MKKQVLVLGSTGMLGSMVAKYLKEQGMGVVCPGRSEILNFSCSKYKYIINCIGIIKQKLKHNDEAIFINSMFPHMLSQEAPKSKIIQIATDCVYSGKKGNYIETDEHDATDVYGKTKSLGEVEAKNFYNIRCSIVGIEPKGNYSLLSWFLSQKKGATIQGYTNHYWNGVTTLQFAKMCYYIIKNDYRLANRVHIVPLNTVSKYELLKIFADKFNRQDIKIIKTKAPEKIDRTISNITNSKMSITIEKMVEDLAKYEYYKK
jgi:dTDP-4-dehydrorhamnose reductase